jgi:hypothetical protein
MNHSIDANRQAELCDFGGIGAVLGWGCKSDDLSIFEQ